MSKIIEISLSEENKLILKCGDVCKQIDDYTLSARDIYELLDYSCGDSYEIKNNVEGKNEIIRPIEELFKKIFDGINAMKKSDEMVNNDILEVEETKE